jgi:hypothetical protein
MTAGKKRSGTSFLRFLIACEANGQTRIDHPLPTLSVSAVHRMLAASLTDLSSNSGPLSADGPIIVKLQTLVTLAFTTGVKQLADRPYSRLRVSNDRMARS